MEERFILALSESDEAHPAVSGYRMFSGSRSMRKLFVHNAADQEVQKSRKEVGPVYRLKGPVPIDRLLKVPLLKGLGAFCI